MAPKTRSSNPNRVQKRFTKEAAPTTPIKKAAKAKPAPRKLSSKSTSISTTAQNVSSVQTPQIVAQAQAKVETAERDLNSLLDNCKSNMSHFLDTSNAMLTKLRGDTTTTSTTTTTMTSNVPQSSTQKIEMVLPSQVSEERKEIDRLKSIIKEYVKKMAENKKKQWCANCWSEASLSCCWNTAYCSELCKETHLISHECNSSPTKATTSKKATMRYAAHYKMVSKSSQEAIKRIRRRISNGFNGDKKQRGLPDSCLNVIRLHLEEGEIKSEKEVPSSQTKQSTNSDNSSDSD